MLLPIAAAAAILALIFALKYFRLRRDALDLCDALDSRSPVIALNASASKGRRASRELAGRLNRLLEQLAQLERQSSGRLQQIETTLGSLNEGVLILDRDNYILLMNKGLETLFPNLADAVGKRVESGLRSSDFLSLIDQVKKGEGVGSREMVFTQGKMPIWVKISASRLAAAESGNGPWYLYVLHDITELKRLESVRKQFVANASHELKTPVAIIKGYAETLLTDHHAMAFEDRNRFLETVHRHSERLALLVNDLLSLSHLEGDARSFQWLEADVVQWLMGCSQDYRANLELAGRELRLAIGSEAAALVRFDANKLRQVLDNLIDNAVKYSPAGLAIELGARVEADEVEIWIKDAGPGVPAADLGRIFERFYRIDKGRARETGGTGLGLSIVKHIVEWHEGRVWAENAREGGLRMAVRLPLASRPSDEARQEPS